MDERCLWECDPLFSWSQCLVDTGLVLLTFISAVLQQDQQLSPVVLNQELLTCSNRTWYMKVLCGQQPVKGVCLKD